MFGLKLAFILFNCLLVCIGAEGQTPPGFHWVNFKTEAETVSKIQRVLKDEEYSAIREIGLTDRFALVFTVERETGQSESVRPRRTVKPQQTPLEATSQELETNLCLVLNR